MVVTDIRDVGFDICLKTIDNVRVEACLDGHHVPSAPNYYMVINSTFFIPHSNLFPTSLISRFHTTRQNLLDITLLIISTPPMFFIILQN